MKYIHLLSGGLDSTVLLYDILNQGAGVHCLAFDYGQKHVRELEFAYRTCKKLNITLDRITLPPMLFKRSSLTGEKKKALIGSATVVPNRNMVMLSMAVSYALTCGSDAATWASNADDAAVYPDCRLEFYQALNKTVNLCDNSAVRVSAPYIEKSKREIVSIGKGLGVNFEETWSCYMGGGTPCQECGACKTRNQAMA